MTDIYTSVAQDAWRNGRQTRMTEDTVKQEQRLEYLAGLMAAAGTAAANAEKFAKERREEESYLRALIERERVDPTPVSEVGPADTEPVSSAPLNGGGSLLSGSHPAVPPAMPGPFPPPPSLPGREDDPADGGTGGTPWT